MPTPRKTPFIPHPPKPVRDLDMGDVEADAREMYDRMEAEHESGRRIAWERDEHDACEAGTEGCCIDHTRESEQGLRGEGCDTW